jgi:hypothetical protein
MVTAAIAQKRSIDSPSREMPRITSQNLPGPAKLVGRRQLIGKIMTAPHERRPSSQSAMSQHGAHTCETAPWLDRASCPAGTMRTRRACRCSAGLPEGGVRTFLAIGSEEYRQLDLVGPRHLRMPLAIAREVPAPIGVDVARHVHPRRPFRSGIGISLPIEIDLPAVRAKISAYATVERGRPRSWGGNLCRPCQLTAIARHEVGDPPAT